jgi:hypothetical protein
MRTKSITLILLSISIVATAFRAGHSQTANQLQASFAHPPDDARVMMRWWWFGPAVTKPELEKEMRLMKEGGIGGFEVQPVYPLVLDDSAKGIKALPFLSDEFLDALRFTSETARELGLRFDLTLGSGWPFGGPMVSIEHAAARLRYEHVKLEPDTKFVKVPAIGAGERLLAVFLGRSEGSSFAPESFRELTNISNGVVTLTDIPAGSHEVLFFISSRTGMQVKRPAVGGEGFVLDHLNRAATDFYLKAVGERLLQPLAANLPYAIFCDSLEVYNSDWSSDFLKEFQRRRGYDLKPQLPLLVNDLGPRTRAVRRDWGLTLTELLNERFLQPLHDWAKQHHTLFRIQDYGVPAAALSSNAFADLSEGEGHQWQTLSATRWASSASHIYGQPVTSSETWTWLHSPVFRATPLDMKAEADRHFLEGINQLIGHGWPYTAPGIEYPGWRFYAAAVFNEKNPWWIVMPDITRYLQRVSFMMRQGQPANDVAIYLPNDDAWASFTPGNVKLREVLVQRLGRDLVPKVIEGGYGFDFFDADALKQKGKIEKGALVLGANRYRVVILPNVETIAPDVYRKLEEFARGGGVLIATRQKPSMQPGGSAQAAEHDRIKQISKSLFEDPNAPGHFVENEATQLVSELNRRVAADVVLSAEAGEIGFVHRRATDADIYFLANTSNKRRGVKVTFPLKGVKVEEWNPMNGTLAPTFVESGVSEGTAVDLIFDAYESHLLVLSKGAPTVRQMKDVIGSSVELTGPWQVTFAGESKPVSYDRLHSWSDDEARRYFSGTAIYEITGRMPFASAPNLRVFLEFASARPAPEQPLRSGMQAWFDPPVREAALVYFNGERAGSIWCPPYRVDVTALMRNGENRIRIVVGNTALNYMAGHSLPDYRLLNLRYGERFQAQDIDKIQPLPSGLFGPVYLTQQRVEAWGPVK